MFVIKQQKSHKVSHSHFVAQSEIDLSIGFCISNITSPSLVWGCGVKVAPLVQKTNLIKYYDWKKRRNFRLMGLRKSLPNFFGKYF